MGSPPITPLLEEPLRSDFDRDLLLRESPDTDQQLREIIAKPHRHPVLHWAAFVLSLVALAPPVFWIMGSGEVETAFWVWFDLGISAFFILEFFTRSGFRWNPIGYSVSRFYDFIAVVPAGVLVYFAVPYIGVWLWIILVARIIRAIDRLLGDGFVKRNVLALTASFEEEIADRVIIRTLDRIHDDLVRGKFASVVGDSLERNKRSVLNRIRSKHPNQGVGAALLALTGLDLAIERAEERTYDSIVEILKSPEIEKAIHDAVDSSFSVLRTEVAKKEWRKNLGFQKKQIVRDKKQIG
jgi:hypothetical protein